MSLALHYQFGNARLLGMSTPQYTEIEQKLGSPLAQLVGERRASGISWRKIAVEITARTGVDVTGETLRVWHLGIPARVA
jgi:hypothetical protein